MMYYSAQRSENVSTSAGSSRLGIKHRNTRPTTSPMLRKLISNIFNTIVNIIGDSLGSLKGFLTSTNNCFRLLGQLDTGIQSYTIEIDSSPMQ